MSHLVVFAGRAGSGKSEALRIASDLMAPADLSWTGPIRIKFAQPLKDMLWSFLEGAGFDEGEIEELIEGHRKDAPVSVLGGSTPRHAMQTLGHEWGRVCMGPQFWVEAWKRRVGLAWNLGSDVVTDDCRYANEAAAVRAEGGHVIMVVRPDGHRTGEAHPSEQFDFEPDITIYNTGSLEDLRDQVKAALQAVGVLPEC